MRRRGGPGGGRLDASSARRGVVLRHRSIVPRRFHGRGDSRWRDAGSTRSPHPRRLPPLRRRSRRPTPRRPTPPRFRSLPRLRRQARGDPTRRFRSRRPRLIVAAFRSPTTLSSRFASSSSSSMCSTERLATLNTRLARRRGRLRRRSAALAAHGLPLLDGEQDFAACEPL